MKAQHTKPAIAVLGGDKRQSFMVRELASYGYPLHVFGLAEEKISGSYIEYAEDWKTVLEDASAVILPLPVTLDGVRVHAPDIPENQRPRLDILLREMEGMLLLGGRISEDLKHHAAIHDIECIDYFDSEPLQLKNALATAEGAISIMMKELPCTVDGTQVAIIGYGRIGELLSSRLYALGAKVTVYARREEVVTRACLSHLSAIRLDEYALLHIKKDIRVIFNTVPECLFNKRILRTMRRDCIFIDLASAPGGIDHRAAQEIPIKTIWATALPGKYAPESAGKYIAQTIRSILDHKTLSRIDR